jgi:hypothetical protein
MKKLLGAVLCWLGFHDYYITAAGGRGSHYWENTKCRRCGVQSGWSNY